MRCLLSKLPVLFLLMPAAAFAGLPANVAITGPNGLALTSPAIGTPGSTQTITLTFASNATSGFDARLDSLALAGINAGNFAIVGGTCAAGTTFLGTGNPSCTVVVQYTASSAAPANAQLNASCVTVGAIGGYVLSCNGTTGPVASMIGTLLAALVATPMLDPRMLTALFALLLAAGVYYANRKHA
ncbi:MAG: hypothetical protein JSS28_07935 [Proteobacteria bacterium]|nr:hypothetical protein [Pseudomonadota bacterium]